MRIRTLGRELFFKFLYSSDVSGKRSGDDFEPFAADQEPSAEARAFARDLVLGALPKADALITSLESVSPNWTWRRMPAVDRNILLAGIYELLCIDDVHPTVTINEYVDIAKRYGSATSGAFVNGVLDAVRKQLAPKKGAKPAARE